jgi:hypothetical protein
VQSWSIYGFDHLQAQAKAGEIGPLYGGKSPDRGLGLGYRGIYLLCIYYIGMRNVTQGDVCEYFVESGIECEASMCFVNVGNFLRMREVSRSLAFHY